MVLGDFNTFLTPEDKEGGVSMNHLEMSQFHHCLSKCELSLIPRVGDRFTWEKEGVLERLDWGFCNFEWELANPNLKLFHQLRFNSDHRVIVISPITGRDSVRTTSRFQYQAAWNLEPDFKSLTKTAWEGKSWQEGQSNFVETVTEWNATVVGNISQKKRKLLRRLEGIDRARHTNRDTGLFRLEHKL